MTTSKVYHAGEPLELSHQSVIQERLKHLGFGLSEYCFSNLYLFRHVHRYKLINLQYPLISGITYDGVSTLMPTFDLAIAGPEFLNESLTGFDAYYPISRDDLKYFDPDCYTFSVNPDDSDYVYSVEKFKNYSGRKLASKRNLLTQFLNSHYPTVHQISSKTIPHAVSVLDQWLEDVGKEKEDTDYNPCIDALNNLQALCLSGYIYLNRGKPLGFLITKEIIPGMCVIHFAKGLRNVKGIFQYMFHDFANKLSDRFQWLNFEQDLGKPNFRKTKSSYQPDKRLKKYRVSFRTK